MSIRGIKDNNLVTLELNFVNPTWLEKLFFIHEQRILKDLYNFSLKKLFKKLSIEAAKAI